MIQKHLYYILSQDNNDDDPVIILPELQKRTPSLVSLDTVPFYYKSLKTLINPSNDEWYNDHIIYEKYVHLEDLDLSRRVLPSKDNPIIEEWQLPVIGIGITQPIYPKDNTRKLFTCEITLHVVTKAHEINQNKVRNIAFRIYQLLGRKFSLNKFVSYCNMFNDYSINSLDLTFKNFAKFLNNYVILNYQCDFSIM